MNLPISNLSILAVDYGPDLLNDIANQYIKAINSGFGLIRSDVTYLLDVLIILSLVHCRTSNLGYCFQVPGVDVGPCRRNISCG